jgi:homoserine O-acetyltransferase
VTGDDLPKGESLYEYDWHNTPNRRFPSVLDFQELCAELDICIVDAIYVDSTSGEEVEKNPNHPRRHRHRGAGEGLNGEYV